MEPGLDILDAIDRAALQKRGTLRAWMLANRAAFEERLLTRKPDWPTLARVFSDAGLLDARGNPPTAEATRKTWYRVKEDLTRNPGKKAATTVATTSAQATQSTREPATNVSRPAGTFKLDLSPKEDDKDRLFGRHVIRKHD